MRNEDSSSSGGAVLQWLVAMGVSGGGVVFELGRVDGVAARCVRLGSGGSFLDRATAFLDLGYGATSLHALDNYSNSGSSD